MNRNFWIMIGAVLIVVMALCTLAVVVGLNVIIDPPPALPPGR